MMLYVTVYSRGLNKWRQIFTYDILVCVSAVNKQINVSLSTTIFVGK
jgi:hypothetical protein